MFDPLSRYSGLPLLTYTDAEGHQHAYVSRRIVPQPGSVAGTGTVTVRVSDRPDLVAARALGDAVLFWRLADANGAMNPLALTETPGSTLRLSAPQFPGAR